MHLVGLGVVVERGLLDTAAVLQDLTLALQLACEAPLDKAKGVHVLELGLGAESAVGVAYGDVGVAAKLPLLHVGFRNADSPQDVLELVGCSPRRFGRWDVGFGDDLHQGRAAAVEVDQGADGPVHAARGADVYVLRRVLLQVKPRDADPDPAFRGRYVDVTTRTDRLVELGDLVPLGKVGVEVVLPGEDRPVRDVAVEREPGHHPELDGLLVGDGQGPWMAEADGAGVGVRGIAVAHPAATKHLGRGRQVDVKLEPYDRPIRTLLLHFQMPAPVTDSPAVTFSF